MKKSLICFLISIVIISVFSLFSLSGCAAGEEIVEEAAEAGEVAEEAEAPGEELEFVCVAKGIHPYFDPGGVGMEDAAAEIGNINTRYLAPAEWSGEAQTKMIEDLIAEGVDGIAVAVFEAGSMEPVINEAMKQGIPIIIWDDDVPSSDRVCFIGTSNFDAGVAQGEKFVELKDGESDYIIWVQDLAARSVLDRVDGIRSVTDEYPDVVELSDVQMAGYGIDEALVTAESLLQTYPELDATMDVGMNGAIAMHRVMEEKGIPKEDILNISWTLIPEIMEGLEAGYIYASMRQNPYAMGYLATYGLKWYIDGLRPNQKFKDMGLHFDSGITYVDQSNMDVIEDNNMEKARTEMLEEFKGLWE